MGNSATFIELPQPKVWTPFHSAPNKKDRVELTLCGGDQIVERWVLRILWHIFESGRQLGNSNPSG